MEAEKKTVLFVMFLGLKTLGWNSWDMFLSLIAQYDKTLPFSYEYYFLNIEPSDIVLHWMRINTVAHNCTTIHHIFTFLVIIYDHVMLLY
jgi:hypothetical protein